jgi:hypothetical protein
MRELRALHTGGLRPRRSVLAELQAAYEKVVASATHGRDRRPADLL